MEILDFPPAPKLNVYGELDATLASASERRAKRSSTDISTSCCSFA
jgi:hypothetical protein